MPNPLTHTLASIFRSKTRQTSLRRLEREGIRTVNVLDLSRLEEIVGEAIERALRDVTQDGVSAHAVTQGAQVELYRMLGDTGRLEAKNDDLRREQSVLEGHLHQLHDALSLSQRELEKKVEKADVQAMQELRTELDRSMREAFERAAADAERQSPEAARAVMALHAPLRDSMLALIASALRRARPNGATSAAELEVELLERRVRKLTATLTETQELLDRVRGEKEQVEEGVPSIYRELQGLKGSGERVEQRKALLRQILEHNLELRRTMSEEKGAQV